MFINEKYTFFIYILFVDQQYTCSIIWYHVFLQTGYKEYT
jgi:hypothetical protein